MKKEIKAWALVHPHTGKLWADAFCLAIFEDKITALAWFEEIKKTQTAPDEGFFGEVIPIEIKFNPK